MVLTVNHQCFGNARQTQHWEPLTKEPECSTPIFQLCSMIQVDPRRAAHVPVLCSEMCSSADVPPFRNSGVSTGCAGSPASLQRASASCSIFKFRSRHVSFSVTAVHEAIHAHTAQSIPALQTPAHDILGH